MMFLAPNLNGLPKQLLFLLTPYQNSSMPRTFMQKQVVRVQVLFLQPICAVWLCARSCPPHCFCTQEKNCSVLCDHLGLSQVPNGFPCKASFISLDKNNIKFLSEKAFGTLPSLQRLSLNHNNLSFITPGTFKGLPNLAELKMAHNKYIRYLHTRTFTALKKLTKLDLADCNLFNVPDRIFIDLPSLQELIFFQNNFRRIPGAIRGMRNLTHIYLERNKIEAVAYNSLQDLGNLTYLNLQANKISVIHDKSFQDCKRMEYLYLNDNLLSELPEASFKELRHLKMLNLGRNFIRNVSSAWFQDLVELEVLYLDQNSISYIEEGTFENLSSLVSLHLNGNNLKSFSYSIFKPIYFLGKLYLFRNPWDCNCKIEWLKEWMESYRLVRDIPCFSPKSVAGVDLSEVTFHKSPEGFCLDPAEHNTSVTPTVVVGIHSTMESKLNSFLSKLLLHRGRLPASRNVSSTFSNFTGIEGMDDGSSSGIEEHDKTHLTNCLLVFIMAQIVDVL
uniref:Nyctalopin n=1 Tax=Geotrypetes seraphini TaxID=260995 RepID=A0A6P8RJ64_GEOSA|nr:nyctalopin [Geotrypetes seraphini]